MTLALQSERPPDCQRALNRLQGTAQQQSSSSWHLVISPLSIIIHTLVYRLQRCIHTDLPTHMIYPAAYNLVHPTDFYR